MGDTVTTSPFYDRLRTHIDQRGGMWNAHLHLDRAGTLDDIYLRTAGLSVWESSHVSLHEKHALIGALHRGKAYQRDDLRVRATAFLDAMVAVGTRRADTMVDVAADGLGLSALETLQDLQKERGGEIELRLGAYSPLGFTDADPARWETFVEGASRADFIGSLPEADDRAEYPDHIGFAEHCKRVLRVASELGKMVHVHTDQRNEPGEQGTEQLIHAVAEHGAPRSPSGEPMVWAVHVVSPSTYEERRFEALVEGLVRNQIGVICCPSAALGMRQLRSVHSPTYNSIPRVLEMVAAGVHVRIGSDNIADICSPSTTANLVDEVFVLSAALRFYNPEILATLAAGLSLSDAERRSVRNHLRRNRLEIEKALRPMTA